MDLRNYIEEKKQLQLSILSYLHQENTEEEDNYENLSKLIHDQKIAENKNKLTAYLHLISIISSDHKRTNDFQSKIEQLISLFTNEIKKYYQNYELFHIFKKSKRVLLYLIQNNLISLDPNIAKIMTKDKYLTQYYPHYFYPEIKQFLTDEKLINSIQKDISKFTSNEYESLRQTGENEQDLCHLIRTDSLEDFISHVDKDRNLLFEPIKPSIFETHPFLSKRRPTPLEYAAFFGSEGVFRHLCEKRARFTPEIWLYAVHGASMPIIDELVKRETRAKDYSYVSVLDESFRCMNSDVTNFIIEKVIRVRESDKSSVMARSISRCCFSFCPEELNSQASLCAACRADDAALVDKIVNLSNKNFQINEPIETVLICDAFVKFSNMFDWCFRSFFLFEWCFSGLFWK